MSTNEKDVEKAAAKIPTFNNIDRSVQKIAGLACGHESAVTQGQPSAIARVVAIYSGIKPLLVALSTIAFLPKTWQAAIMLFTGALDGLAATVNPDFKAGKDL